MPKGNPNIKESGKKFSKDYQPPKGNNGRPKNVFKRYHELFECSAEDVTAVLTELISQSVEELRAIAKDKNTPALRSCIATAVLKDKENGNLAAVNFLTERLFGKAVQRTEQVNIDTKDEAVASVLAKHGVTKQD